ncbi:hypothetical protein ACIBKX_36960 [Streptomyces sp. NPDC050658]|uniref:hypothetical protein n=1 Tax=unclassified Streptomyces TaxID=2593676 RepID=UPI00342B969A
MRHTAGRITDDELDALYVRLAKAERAASLLADARRRAQAMERAMESTAADALAHRGCHRNLMAQRSRAERAEAAIECVRALHRPVGVVAAAESGQAPDCTICGPNRWPCPTYEALTDLAPPGPPATQATGHHDQKEPTL